MNMGNISYLGLHKKKSINVAYIGLPHQLPIDPY